MHDVEVLLAVLLLARFEVREANHRLLRIVERHVLHVVEVGVVWRRKGEVELLRPVEVVERLRRLAQTSLRHVSHPVAVEGVVDAVVRKRGVDITQLHAVVVAADVPHEVRTRPRRVVEEVALERLADFALLLGGILLLLAFALLAIHVLVGVAAVERPRLPVLLRTHERPSVQSLSGTALGPHDKEQPGQKRPEDFVRPPIHTFRSGFAPQR